MGGRARCGRLRVLLYRQAAQWRMYGASAARTQAQRGIRLRPPFRIVWSRGLGSLLAVNAGKPISGNGGLLLLYGYSRLFAVEPAR